MPYRVSKGKGRRPWKITNKQTGKTVGASTTKAEGSVRARGMHRKR